MKKEEFSIEKDGFYGFLYTGKGKNFAIILYVNDDPNGMIGKGAAK